MGVPFFAIITSPFQRYLVNVLSIFSRYWDSLQKVIRPRFEQVFRMNTQSVRDCDPTKFNKETGPHYVRKHQFKYSNSRNNLPFFTCRSLVGMLNFLLLLLAFQRFEFILYFIIIQIAQLLLNFFFFLAFSK